MTFEGWIQEAAERFVELRLACPKASRWDPTLGDGPGPLAYAFRQAREKAMAAEGLKPMVISGEHTYGPLRDQAGVDRDIALCAIEILLKREGRVKGVEFKAHSKEAALSAERRA